MQNCNKARSKIEVFNRLKIRLICKIPPCILHINSYTLPLTHCILAIASYTMYFTIFSFVLHLTHCLLQIDYLKSSSVRLQGPVLGDKDLWAGSRLKWCCD